MKRKREAKVCGKNKLQRRREGEGTSERWVKERKRGRRVGEKLRVKGRGRVELKFSFVLYFCLTIFMTGCAFYLSLFE